MQTLWARALQVKSTCRCPACANPQKALARRVNTVPSKRGSRAGDLAFSAFFSTSIAAGAIADAKYKQGKREDLDGVLIAAKEDLRTVDADQARRLRVLGLDIPEPSPKPSSQNNKSEDTWFEQTSSKRVGKKQTWQPAPDHLSINDDAGPSSFHFSGPQLNHEPRSRKNGLSRRADTRGVDNQPESPKHSRKLDKQRKKAQTSPRTSRRPAKDGSKFFADVDTSIPSQEALSRLLLCPKPVDTTLGRPDREVWASSATPPVGRRGALQCQNAVAKLIYKIILFRLSRPDGFPVTFPDGTRVFAKGDEPELKRIVIELNRSRRGLIQSSREERDLLYEIKPLTFPPYQWATTCERGQALAESGDQEMGLLDLFSQRTSLDQLLSKLCSTLACHSQPPSIHMFNILIIRLSYLQLPRLVTYVIDAMKETFQVQNEITHTAVLQNYTDANNSPKFHEHLNNMDGLMGKGYYPARDHAVTQSRNPASHVVSHPVAKHALNEFKSESSKVRYYKVPRTIQMYEAIIEGLLKFNNLRRALSEYSRLIRSDLIPTIDIYRSFLEYCVKFKAWKIGWVIWDHLNNNVKTDDPFVYYWMLQLCASCDRRSEFKAINQQAVRHKIIGCELNIESFQWTKGEFDQTFLHANSIRRLQRNIQVPSYPTKVPDGPQFSSQWPANLLTIVQERLQVLVQGKEDAVGFSLQAHTDVKTEHPSVWASKSSSKEQKTTITIQ